MPGTTPAKNSNKKSEVELVSERVTKTKKEIEQLKAQLQKLIDDGISKNDTETKQNLASLSNECKTDITHNEPVHNLNDKLLKMDSEVDINKAKTFKDNISDIIAPQQSVIHTSVTLRCKDKSPLKQATKDVSPKKTRHYDQEAAREYIKKQKEKRRESLKNKKKEVGFTQDIKKQRLNELRQKSLLLISKNIQHKRERSRSRSQDALDQHESKHIENGGGRVAQIQDKFSAQVKNESVKSENDLVPNLTETKLEPPTKFVHPELKNITVRSNLRDLSAIPKLDIPKHIQFDIDNLSIESSAHTRSTHRSHPKMSLSSFQQKKEEQQNSPIKSTQSTTVTSSMHPNTERKHTTPIKSPTFNQPTRLVAIEKHKAAIKIQAVFRGYRQRKLYYFPLKMKQEVKEQAAKEVETVKIKSDIPVWLQAPVTLPYPYNFISTVKRKLNLAVQQTTATNDVAVQSSLIEQKNNTLDKTEKSSKQRNSNHKNTDLKSFLSHKCLDLDMKSIEPLALTRNSSLHDRKSSAHSTVVNPILKPELNGFASDSDTSKNIPEISSESSAALVNKLHFSKRAHSSDTDHDDQLKINTNKIKKLKLLQPKRLNFSSESIKSHGNLKQSEEISEHISGANSTNREKSKSLSNFRSAAEIDFSGRDSIIASNKCNYSQNKTNQKSIEISNNIDLSQHKSSQHSIKISEPVILSQDTSNRFRNYMKSVNDEKNMEGNDSNVNTDLSSEKLPENSKNKEISLKASAEISDVDVELEKSESTKNIHTSLEKVQEYSSNFTSALSTVSSSIPSLKRPNVSLKSSQRIFNSKNADGVGDGKAVASIILKPDEKTEGKRRIKSNEIHLKFEAELHLLNEFNDSLRQIMAMDKSLMELRNNSSNIHNDKTYQTRDTQTSFVVKSSTNSKITTESPQDVSENHSHVENKNQIQIPTINYSRGSEVSEQMDIFSLHNTIVETNDTSLVTTGLELSELKDNMLTSSNEESNVGISVSFAKENLYTGNVCTGLSLDMFEQLIKDEDARIENLKTILKIREKALVDRTKGELAWLEIQKKHLRDSGQLQEISAIKKKQRGLLIKLEHERHEMQRLKQMQKAASKERKSVLREQRNMIKAQLSNTSNMLTKIKRNAKEERRHSGPLKVYNIKSHSESIRSETSMSRRSSVAEEIISVVSHTQSIISHVKEEAITSKQEVQQKTDDVAAVSSNPQVKTEHVKRSLLMRETALQKRRKAAEELLQWHQRLIEEEEKIAELELAASAIINQVSTVPQSMVSDESTVEKHKFKGSQLNLLWHNMTGREEKKFNDHMSYTMSKISLERFCKDAKKYAISRNKNFNSKKSGKVSDSDSSLSAIDITVTELTQNKYKNNSNSEKRKKFKSKSSHLSEISSQIVTSKNKSKDSQDYTSDFESLLSLNKESGLNTVSTDEELKVLDETIIPHNPKNRSNDSKMSSVGEISQCDKDIDTIAEQSNSIRNILAFNETNQNEIIEEKVAINEQSVEIIDDNTASTNIFNHDNYNKISNSIPENLKSIHNITDGDKNLSISIIDKNEKLVEDIKVTQSEANQDSTSKDVSMDIEHDDKRSESLELKLNNNTKEIDEISHSVSQQTEIKTETVHSVSNEFVPSEHISTNTEILDNLISKSSDVKEDIESKDQLLSSPSEDQSLSKTNEKQSLQIDPSLTRADNCQLLSKTNENQPTETDQNELFSEVNSNENKLLSKSNEDQMFNETYENLSKTNEDELLTNIDDDCLLSKSHDSQLFTRTNEVTAPSKIDGDLSTKISEKINKTNENHISNKTEEDLKSSEANGSSIGEASEQSVNESVECSTNTENENRILIANKPDRLHLVISEIKTVESDDDTEIISDEEWNQLSGASEFQKLNIMRENSCIENVTEVNKNNIEEKEDSIKTTSSISEKIESPLLLSYGFVEKKESDDETEVENSLLDKGHVEDTSQQVGLEISSTTETNFIEEKHERNEKPKDDINKSFEDCLEDKKLKSNVNHTSDNQLKDKSEDDLNQTFEIQEKSEDNLNQTYEINLDEAAKHKIEETDTPHKEKKITTELDYIDVKKRVSEILADANIPNPRGDKSPRLQDLYVTAYDVVSPEHSSTSGSPIEDIEQTFTPPHQMYGSDEVEELLKKQLEIEQEIKEIQQQQQKEHIPYLYVREIPNKPPPPYTPPITIQTPVSGSILPATEKQIGIIAKSAAEILHNAYLNAKLQNVTLSADDQKIMQSKNNIDKNCFEFVFDLCKEAAIDHYKQFETETGPSWMHLTKRSKLALGKPLDECGLEKVITTKVRQWLGYETVKSTENIKHKWSGKKRDHVDELLVVECQAEETEWTNYDRDELIVKDELTKDIMNMLLSETAQVFNNILNKKAFLC